MKQFSLFSLMTILITSSALAGEASSAKSIANPYSIDSREFNGFEECAISSKLTETINGLIRTRMPDQKEATAWTYAVNSEVFDLPVKRMLIGVCDISGERGCGWGNFIALVIPRPLPEVKKHLKNQTGTDFTEQKRAEEANVTLRPVLARGKNPGESILYCDPGDL